MCTVRATFMVDGTLVPSMPREGYRSMTVHEETHEAVAALKELDVTSFDSFDAFVARSAEHYLDTNAVDIDEDVVEAFEAHMEGVEDGE